MECLTGICLFWFSAHDVVVTTAVFSPQPSLVVKPADADGKSPSSSDPTAPSPTILLPTEGSESPATRAKREMIQGKGMPEAAAGGKGEKKSSLKRLLDQGELLVSGDFNGAIKVFIKRPKL